MSYIEKEPLCAWLKNMSVSDFIIDCIKDEKRFPSVELPDSSNVKSTTPPKLNVYEVLPKSNYAGRALVAAESTDEADQFIMQFKQRDPNNEGDSWGYDRTYYIKEHLYSDVKGIIDYGIYYIG